MKFDRLFYVPEENPRKNVTQHEKNYWHESCKPCLEQPSFFQHFYERFAVRKKSYNINDIFFFNSMS